MKPLVSASSIVRVPLLIALLTGVEAQMEAILGLREHKPIAGENRGRGNQHIVAKLNSAGNTEATARRDVQNEIYSEEKIKGKLFEQLELMTSRKMFESLSLSLSEIVASGPGSTTKSSKGPKSTTKSSKGVKSATKSSKGAKAGSCKSAKTKSSKRMHRSSPGVQLGSYNVGFTEEDAPVTFDRKIPAIPTGEGLTFLPYARWYPTIDTSGTPAKYTTLSGIHIDIGAFEDADLSEDECCHPLIIYSHANNLMSVSDNQLMKRLASYGFIVVAPTHVGSDDQAFLEGTANTAGIVYDRPRDVQIVRDAVLNDLGERVCADKIAVVGFSLGAFTALAVGNGHTNIYYDDFAADDSFAAVVAMAPPDFLFVRDGDGNATDLVDSSVPTLIMGAELDYYTPIASDTDPIWDAIACSTKQTYRVDLEGAGHSAFTDICEINKQLFAATSASLGVPESDIAAACIGAGPSQYSTCLRYWPALPADVDGACRTGVDVCNFFGSIVGGLVTALGAADPIAKCSELGLTDHEQYLCGSLANLDASHPFFLDPLQCQALLPALPTLPIEDAHVATGNYVVSFLKEVFAGRSGSFQKFLREDFVHNSGFSVMDDSLFLVESVNDVCYD